ncbi:MAG: serine/threonine protein kinase [Myxococcales bacterium]|nr:serine/threonine protein kinase [Myxococcales bacterium]MCB9629609.1 serine/threonine protein kinase [Sandaracinaceae bacterium]
MSDRIGNYRVLNEVGAGGMAVVYKAIQEPLGRLVAIKALKSSIAMDSQFAMRFEREAHFMASLQHENILHVVDFVKDGNSMYIVMEYVQGIDLYDLLELSPVLPAEEAAIIALQIARALDYAHFRGIIHRDIKPANIMLSKQGEVKLMDFGIARDDKLSDLTETGTGLGTPSYMSPEQILGDKLDFRSDIFSVGIVLYQMVTGRKPFVEDESRTVMQKIRLDRFAPPRKLNPKVPRQLERIMSRCMEKMPASRYPSTQALIDDLVEFLAPRVPINYSAKLVMYLRDVGFLTDDEAEHVLEAAGPRNIRRRSADPTLLRDVSLLNVGLLLGVLGGGFAIQASSDSEDGDPAPSLASERGADAARSGAIRVVVDPWAEVFVDGEQVATTPTAQAIALSPGLHYLRFTNPYYTEVEREVRVRTGETEWIDVVMTPRHATAGADSAGSLPAAGAAPDDALAPAGEAADVEDAEESP